MNTVRLSTAGWTAAFRMALVAILLTSPARAGMITDCTEPKIFADSDVNLVILPYAFDGPAPDLQLKPNSLAVWENNATRALSTLIQLDALYSLRFPAGMAVIQLFTDRDDCTVQSVRERVDLQIADGKGIVLLWGSVIERDGELFVQSYVEFYRKGRSAVAEFTIPSLGQDLTFFGELPQSGLGFAPRILNKTDVGAIESAAESARAISSTPGGPRDRFLPDQPTTPFAFYVTGITEPGWMQVQTHSEVGGEKGWISADPEWPLRSKLPELDFVEAAMGFVAAQIIREEKNDDHWTGPWRLRYARARERSALAINRFLEANTLDEDEPDVDIATSDSIAHAMKGALILGDPSLTEGEPQVLVDNLKEAAGDLHASLRIIPYLPETWNVAAIANAGLARIDEAAAKRAVEYWRSALSLAPRSEFSTRNLATFYRALNNVGELEKVGISDDELSTRLEFLERRSR